MKFKEVLDKFLITLGYIFIGVLSALIGLFFIKRKKITNEDLEPGDIIDALPNSDAVRRRIDSFGTATGNNGGRKSDDADSRGRVRSNGAPGGNPGILTRWVDSAKRMGIRGTSEVLRVRDRGSTQGTDDTS